MIFTKNKNFKKSDSNLFLFLVEILIFGFLTTVLALHSLYPRSPLPAPGSHTSFIPIHAYQEATVDGDVNPVDEAKVMRVGIKEK
jgi:hypothetical protein